MEMYSALCQTLPRRAIVSLPSNTKMAVRRTPNEPTAKIDYKRPDDSSSPYHSRTKVVIFRRPFLTQQVQEICCLLDHVQSMGKGDASTTVEGITSLAQ